MLIAFIGVDGSGKTTFANKTVECLRKNKHSVILIKPFEYLFLKKFLNNKSSNRAFDNKAVPFYYKFWAFFALIDNLFYYQFKIKPLLRKYDFVVCDRYFHDFVLSFEYFGFILPQFSGLYLRLIPKPNLLFILNVPPRIAMDREKDQKHSLEFYKFMVKKYSFLGNLGILINNSGKPDFLKIKEYLNNKLVKS